MSGELFRYLTAVAFSFVAACGSEATEPAARSAGDWVLDKAASTLNFRGTQTGREFTGSFSKFDAVIVFDPDDLGAAKIEVVVDTASAETGDRQRDAALPTADWFAAAKFPTATFTSSDVVRTGEGRYEARGQLKIREFARPVLLPFTLKIDGDRARADGSLTLRRTDYGVGQGEFSTDAWVGFNVEVKFHVEATR
jgi:polyisoprenoid-binding protein YceI